MRLPQFFDAVPPETRPVEREWLAMQTRWSRQDRWLRRIGSLAWALFALLVFAGTAHETGKLSAATFGAAREGGSAASHKAGPSIVADQRHSKTEGKCR